MNYVSLFSGIDAASVAWKPLGWHCCAVAEIEAFPCAVLAHYYPQTPNLGDVTKITEDQIISLGPVDVLIFGSPCQDLSVAGKREGLAGARSGLFHDAMRICGWLRKYNGLRFAIFENVPGLFSSNKGRDFAVVVGTLAGLSEAEIGLPEKGWGTEGCALGSEGLVEWGVLDAQFWGLAQRRRRVFALADFGDWANRCPILLEPESLRGNSPSREQARQSIAGSSGRSLERSGSGPGLGIAKVAPTISARQKGGGGLGTDFDLDSGLVPTAGGCVTAFGGNNTSGPIDVATARSSSSSPHGRLDFESETFVTHSLRAEGFDASEDGTGRGIPLVPVCFDDPRRFDANGVHGGGEHGDLHPVLRPTNPAALICFSSKDHGADAERDLSPTLRAGGHSESHPNAGVPPAIAFALRGRAEGAQAEVRGAGDGVSALRSASGGSTRDYVAFDTTQITAKANYSSPKVGDPCHPLAAGAHAPAIAGSAVRRLTPTECERLQGFPDGHTAITVRGKPAADGPRYKALGNSMAVPVIAWIGRKIDIALLMS